MYASDYKHSKYFSSRGVVLPVFVCILTCMWALWVSAFSPLPRQQLNIGGDPVTLRRGLDEPFLTGFWGAEPEQFNATTSVAYRWTTPSWRITWPMAGRGWFISASSFDATAWDTHNGAVLHWNEPNIGTTQSLHGVRLAKVLTYGDGLSVSIAVTSNRLPMIADRRDLGIILTKTELIPLTGVWRPVQLALLSAALLGTYLILSCLLLRRSWMLAAVGLFFGVGWYSAPLWWMVHSADIVISYSVAAISAMLLVWLVLPRTLERVQWWSVTTLAIAIPLVAVLSPFRHTSDGAMHARMLFDVMRGNIFQIAELPCEAGALTVPYPPLVYLLAAPLTFWTWDRSVAIPILMSGALVVHTGSLLYFLRVIQKNDQRDFKATAVLLLSALSMPFLQSVHIGELTNVWGHALFLIAVTAYFDHRASVALRLMLSIAVLLTHTGVALSFGLTMGTIGLFQWIDTKRIPIRLVAICAVSIASVVGVYYSTFFDLLGQTTKYPGCPTQLSLLSKLVQVPNALPGIVVGLAIVGLCITSKRQHSTVVLSAIIVALLSISVLIFRDQTVRWAIAVYPFATLATTRALQLYRRIGVAGSVLTVCTLMGLLCIGMTQYWERIYSYLH